MAFSTCNNVLEVLSFVLNGSGMSNYLDITNSCSVLLFFRLFGVA